MVVQSLKALITRNPTLFNSLTGGTLCAVSDAGAQHLEGISTTTTTTSTTTTPTGRLDVRRMMAAGFLGVLFGGFVYPTAYAILDARWQGRSFTTLVTKSLVEIATVGVFVNTVSMTCRGLLAGRDFQSEVWHHVKTEMPRVTMSDVGVWLPYNLVAFSVIPPIVRPTTTALMEASWQTYISLRSHDYKNRAAEAAATATATATGRAPKPLANPTSTTSLTMR